MLCISMLGICTGHLCNTDSDECGSLVCHSVSAALLTVPHTESCHHGEPGDLDRSAVSLHLQ